MRNFRKMDEMEMSVNQKVTQLTWVYSTIFLLLWMWHDWIKIASFNKVAFILMTTQMILYWLLQIYLKWKLGKDEK